VDDRDVAEWIRPVRMGAGDVDIGLRRHPDMPDGVRAAEPGQVVLARDLLGVAQVLDDLQGMPQRQDLAPRDVLQVVRERLQVPVVPDRRAVRVLRLALHAVDVSADLRQPRLDFQAVTLKPLAEFEVAVVVRVGQLEPDDHVVGGRPVQRVPGRVGAAVLHGLQHPGHLGPDVAVTVPVDDAGDPAHGCPFPEPPYGRMSRYSFTSQSLTVEMNRIHSSRL
jgi:hypothetical protein